ncbi:MAG: helix-turn-helix transcriptional regulator [Bacteroidales bacterium]
MITQDNYIWVIKASHLTLSALTALGIFLRWKTEAKSRRPLAFMFLLMAIFYTVDLVLAQYYTIHPFMLQQGNVVGYSFGSLYNGMLFAAFLYLYARALFKPLKLTIMVLIRANIILISSLCCYIILLLIGFKPIPHYSFGELLVNLNNNPFAILWLLSMACFEIYAVYISFISLRWLIIHYRNIKNNFSLTGSFKYYYIYVTYFLFSLTIPLGIVTLLFGADYKAKLICGLIFSAIIVLVYIFSYLQEDIYTQEEPMIDVEARVIDDNLNKNIGENIVEGQVIKINDRLIMEKLRILIEERNIYLVPDLSAETLAHNLNISRKKLYLFLKEQYNSTFSDYINGCRIEHAHKIIVDKHNYKLSILEISEMSGFNTTDTFNKFFKSKYHTTPAKYRNSI